MTDLLAIETSGASCSVCLSIDGTRFTAIEHVDKRHNELLLGMLTDVRVRAGLSAQELMRALDAVAFGCGPGSFTGVRIAAAAAQAIAFASDARIVRVSSSAALAEKSLADYSVRPRAAGVLTLIRSRADHYYVAAYRRSGPDFYCEQPDRLYPASPPADWYHSYAGWDMVGEQPGWWLGGPVSPLSADAVQVTDLGLRMFSRGEHVEAMDGLPEYLEGDSPWRKSS